MGRDYIKEKKFFVHVLGQPPSWNPASFRGSSIINYLCKEALLGQSSLHQITGDGNNFSAIVLETPTLNCCAQPL